MPGEWPWKRGAGGLYGIDDGVARHEKLVNLAAGVREEKLREPRFQEQPLSKLHFGGSVSAVVLLILDPSLRHTQQGW